MGTITEDLAAIKSMALEAMEERTKLLAINAELVAALEDYVKQTTEHINGYREALPDASKARAALAKARGTP